MHTSAVAPASDFPAFMTRLISRRATLRPENDLYTLQYLHVTARNDRINHIIFVVRVRTSSFKSMEFRQNVQSKTNRIHNNIITYPRNDIM